MRNFVESETSHSDILTVNLLLSMVIAQTSGNNSTVRRERSRSLEC